MRGSEAVLVDEALRTRYGYNPTHKQPAHPLKGAWTSKVGLLSLLTAEGLYAVIAGMGVGRECGSEQGTTARHFGSRGALAARHHMILNACILGLGLCGSPAAAD